MCVWEPHARPIMKYRARITLSNTLGSNDPISIWAALRRNREGRAKVPTICQIRKNEKQVSIWFTQHHTPILVLDLLSLAYQSNPRCGPIGDELGLGRDEPQSNNYQHLLRSIIGRLGEWSGLGEYLAQSRQKIGNGTGHDVWQRCFFQEQSRQKAVSPMASVAQSILTESQQKLGRENS